MARVHITGTVHIDVRNVPIKRVNYYPDYEGPYAVTPTANDQTLETKEHQMTDDVTVKAIPYFAASNSAGGQTVNIG